MGRKANPDASYLDIKKTFHKRNGKLVEIKEVPFVGSKEVQPSSSLDGLNLVRPVPKKGFTSKADDKQPEIKKPSQTVGKAVGSTKGSVPNVILRKPSRFSEDNVDEQPSRLRIKPNLSLKMGNRPAKDRFSDMTLLRKPDPVSVNEVSGDKQEPKSNVDGIELKRSREEANDEVGSFTLLKKPEPVRINTALENKGEYFGDAEAEIRDDIEVNVLESFAEVTEAVNALTDNFKEIEDGFFSDEAEQDNDSNVGSVLCCINFNQLELPLLTLCLGFQGFQPLEQSDMGSSQEFTALSELSDTKSADSRVKVSMEAALQGKPKRCLILFLRLVHLKFFCC